MNGRFSQNGKVDDTTGFVQVELHLPGFVILDGKEETQTLKKMLSHVARAARGMTARGMTSQARPAITRLHDDICTGPLGELMLTDQDFPGDYVNMAHPQDYTARPHPLQPKLFYNQRANHFRLLLRASFALPDKSFLPMTCLL